MSIKRFFPDTRPTLDLNFAATKRLDPRITYTRASTGTFVGSNGLIQSAATGQARFEHNPLTGESLGLLVEDAKTNLLTYSQAFNSTNYLTGYDGGDFIENATAAPDGTLTASKLIRNAGAAGAFWSKLNKQFIPVVSGTVYTVSCYLKAAEISTVSVNGDLRDGGGLPHSASFTLTGNGSYTLVAGTSAHIENVGNGWYRCSVTGTAATTDTEEPGLIVFGTGTSGQGFFAWGFQLEAGTFPTSYIPTLATFTGRASTATFYDSAGIVQTAASGVARSNAFFPDENRIFRPAGLLLETAGTNLLNHSQTFATSGGTQNDWTDTSITRDGTLRTSPDGTANALRITASAANATVISSSGIGTSAARSLSVFLRRVTGSGAVEYTLDNGSTYTPQAISSSWVRYAFPATTADQQVGIRLVTSGNAIELWGAQLEAGASATSYIATTTTTATRAADTSTSATVTRAGDGADITGANFSSWFNASSGSFVSIAQTPESLAWRYEGAQILGGFSSGGFRTNNLMVNGYYASNVLQTGDKTWLNSAQVASMGGLNIGANQPLLSPRHGCMAWNSTQGIYAINGSLSSGNNTPNASLIGSRVNKLVINGDSINSFYNLPAVVYIKRITFYPSRLPDATLQLITTV